MRIDSWPRTSKPYVRMTYRFNGNHVWIDKLAKLKTPCKSAFGSKALMVGFFSCQKYPSITITNL